MGLIFSPWVATKIFEWAIDIIKVDSNSSDNNFHWSQVILNYPGSVICDPLMTRVYKWNQ